MPKTKGIPKSIPDVFSVVRSGVASALRDMGLSLSSWGTQTTEIKPISPKTGFWENPSSVSSKPPRFVVQVTLDDSGALVARFAEKEQGVQFPMAHTIGSLNSTKGNTAVMVVRVLPTINLQDGSDWRLPNWEWLLVLTFKRPLPAGTSGDALTEYDPVGGTLKYGGGSRKTSYEIACTKLVALHPHSKIDDTVSLDYDDVTLALGKLFDPAGDPFGIIVNGADPSALEGMYLDIKDAIDLSSDDSTDDFDEHPSDDLTDDCPPVIMNDGYYSNIIKQVVEIMSELATAKVVLVKGPPAVGKTLLMSAIAEAFDLGFEGFAKIIGAVQDNKNGYNGLLYDGRFYRYPSPGVAHGERSIIKTSFHMNTKNSDFVCGVKVAQSNNGTKFRWSKGPLIASMDASENGMASLLVIDEINRGPTSAIFGDAIISIDADKRSGLPSAFPLIITAETGLQEKRYIPPDMYVIAGMNEADISVQALDLALLRRFSPYDILPDPDIALRLFKKATEGQDGGQSHESLVDAWNAINGRIARLKGHSYQIGHGIFAPLPVGETPEEYAVRIWRRIDTHVRELFFNDPSGSASVLIADGATLAADHSQRSPYDAWVEGGIPGKVGLRFTGIHSFGPPPRWLPELVKKACAGAAAS